MLLQFIWQDLLHICLKLRSSAGGGHRPSIDTASESDTEKNLATVTLHAVTRSIIVTPAREISATYAKFESQLLFFTVTPITTSLQ